MGEDPTDVELARRHAAGEGTAFGLLVQRHQKRVYNLAYRMLGNRENARDATQEAFLSAFRAMPSFRGDAAFSTWLHRIAVNSCFDALRRAKRSPVVADPLEEAGPAAGSPDPSETVATAVDVQRALVRVPEEFRAVLVMHDVQDLSYDQIADVLGIPAGTVKSRLHRGRISLASYLEGTRSSRPPSEGTVTR